MRPVLSVVLLSLAALGCSDPTETSALLIPVVRVGDTYFTIAEDPAPSTSTDGALIGSVLRLVDCSEGVWLDDVTHVSDSCSCPMASRISSPRGRRSTG